MPLRDACSHAIQNLIYRICLARLTSRLQKCVSIQIIVGRQVTEPFFRMTEMTIIETTIESSDRPATKVLQQLVIADNFFLVVTTLIAVTVLAGWMLSPVGATLPNRWSLMKANSALAVLICIACLTLTKPKRSASLYLAGKVCAAAVIFIASVALFEHWSGYSTGLDTFLAADSAAHIPGSMSILPASFFAQLGLSLMIKLTRVGLL